RRRPAAWPHASGPASAGWPALLSPPRGGNCWSTLVARRGGGGWRERRPAPFRCAFPGSPRATCSMSSAPGTTTTCSPWRRPPLSRPTGRGRAPARPPGGGGRPPPPPAAGGPRPAPAGGPAVWHDPGDEPPDLLGVGYPGLEPESGGQPAGGPGCVRLPYLALGSAGRVGNEG